jgi:hypothetical protein
MAKYGKYGWTPEQMERINARRAAGGRDKLVNLNNPQYEEESYETEEQPQTKRKPAFPTDRPSALEQYKDQKGLGERMAERGSLEDEFRKKIQAKWLMDIEEKIAAEAEKLNKRGKGISTPSLQGYFNRFTA